MSITPRADNAPDPAPKRRIEDDDPRHGTRNGYENLDCRCDRCRIAAVQRMKLVRSERAKLVARHGLPPLVAHGASAYSNWRCRCQICRDAIAAEFRARRAKARR